MTFVGDCPRCGRALGADREVRERGHCDRCEIARLREAIQRLVRADEELEFDATSRQYPSEDAWKEFHDSMGVLREIAREGR